MLAQPPTLHKPPTRKHIFISYASANRAAVADLHQRLKADYLPVWIDNLDVSEGLKAGQPWQDGLAEAMHAATCVVWMASPASIRSEWVRAELRRALELGKPILPYVLDADFTSQPEWDEAKTWLTLDGVPFGDLQRIMPTNLGDDLAYKKLASQLREQVRAAKLTGVQFPSSALEIPISGRDDDLRTVETLLSEQRRLVVVMGVGGTGKTRLAVEIANRQRRFAHGVIWHKIESYTREEALTAQIRDHLTLPTDMHPDEVWTVLGRHSVLIVLDNAESCADIPAYAARLQAYDLSNGTRFLMTSRFQWKETQTINRAYELAVPTLEAAAQIARDMAAHHGDPARLEGREAELAQAARLHPRLIQYAVAWLNADPISEVLTMLQTLKGGADIEALMHDILHQTLGQIETQPGGAQAVANLKRLLVCRGGFTSAAADALLGESSRQSRDILRRWSLLKLEGERYTPDVLVEAALPADESARPAHYDFYLALAKNHDERQDYAGLDPDSANLTAAYDWAMEAGEYEKALNLLNDAYHFLLNRGWVRDFVAQAQQVSTFLADHADKLVWANSQSALGISYYQLSMLENRADNLHRAVVCYKAALIYRTPESVPLDYAKTQNNLGSTYLELSSLEDRVENLRHAIACYESALVYHTPESAPFLHSQTLNNLGAVYGELAEIEARGTNLRRAIACYESALIYSIPESAPLDYSMTQNNLGNAYVGLADSEDRAENLRLAITCYEASLVWWTPESAPLDYATTRDNLGVVYRELAKIEARGENLRRAIECHQAALVNLIPQDSPLDYARAQNGLGTSYSDLAEVEDWTANSKRAMGHYITALTYYTPEMSPLGYAMVQNNLGRVYLRLAKVEDQKANLKHSIACFQGALGYFTPTATPMGYAVAQNNLGAAYSSLAKFEERTDNLKRAIICYSDALKHRSHETIPSDHANTQYNLGLTYSDLAEVEDRLGNLKRAIDCYTVALEHYRPDVMPAHCASAHHAQGLAYFSLAEVEDRKGNLKRAINCFTEALQYRTPEIDPLDYGHTQNGLGIAYLNLLETEERAINLKQAVDCFNAAVKYFNRDTDPLDYAHTQHNLGLAYIDLKDTEKARLAFRDAEQVYRQMGDTNSAEIAAKHLKELEEDGKSCFIFLFVLLACTAASLFSVLWSWNNIGWVAGVVVLVVVAGVWWEWLGKKRQTS